jgi:hypothetical protein
MVSSPRREFTVRLVIPLAFVKTRSSCPAVPMWTANLSSAAAQTDGLETEVRDDVPVPFDCPRGEARARVGDEGEVLAAQGQAVVAGVTARDEAADPADGIEDEAVLVVRRPDQVLEVDEGLTVEGSQVRPGHVPEGLGHVGEQGVQASASEEAVHPEATAEDVVAGVADQHIVAWAAGDVPDAAHPARAGGGSEAQVDGDRNAELRVVEGVRSVALDHSAQAATRLEDERVVARAAGQALDTGEATAAELAGIGAVDDPRAGCIGPDDPVAARAAVDEAAQARVVGEDEVVGLRAAHQVLDIVKGDAGHRADVASG